MSLSMFKMWVSIAAMILMALAMGAIYISRFKLHKGFLKVATALLAWVMMIVGGILMLYILLAGPTV